LVRRIASRSLAVLALAGIGAIVVSHAFGNEGAAEAFGIAAFFALLGAVILK
jgi:hypothetical protein